MATVGAIGAVIVLVFMAAVWIGCQTYSDREFTRYVDRSGDIAAINAGRIGTNRPQEPYPEKPFAVKHPNAFSGLLSLVVGVVGAIVVLLASIAVGVNRRP